MKRVLMVSCDGLGNGGIQQVMMNIVRSLSHEFNFDMLLFTNDVRYFDTEFQQYGKIFRIPHYSGFWKWRKKLDYYIRFCRIYHGVKRILQTNGPYDVIHCHNYFEAAPCLMAAAHCGVPVRISHSHSSMPRSHIVAGGYHFVLRLLLNRYATCQVGCSQLACNYLFGKGEKALNLPNAIDLKRFDITRYPNQKKKHSFVHVGRLCALKNQLFILNVFAQVQKRWPDSSLTLVGKSEGNYQEILFKTIVKLHLKSVKFLPHDTDVPALLAQSEYMIFPSIFEGFGLVLAEAQVMKVKCFASDTIPLEADLGWCQYLSLKLSIDKWTQEIFKTENQSLQAPDTDKVSLQHYIAQIRAIYDKTHKIVLEKELCNGNKIY